jgi:hypothetical protein
MDQTPKRSENIDLDKLKMLSSELSDKANEALLVAKDKGKGQVIFYNEI